MDPALFDPAEFRAVRDLIGDDRVRHHLEGLDIAYQLMIGITAGPDIAAQAHKIVSQAGMFGLIRMSECARRLECACLSGTDLEAEIANCRAACEDVRFFALVEMDLIN